jgi:uncharacterized protein (UPF0297 family)
MSEKVRRVIDDITKFLARNMGNGEWYSSVIINVLFDIKDNDKKTRSKVRKIMRQVKEYAGKKGYVVVSSVKGYQITEDREIIKRYKATQGSRSKEINKLPHIANKALKSTGQRMLFDLY